MEPWATLSIAENWTSGRFPPGIKNRTEMVQVYNRANGNTNLLTNNRFICCIVQQFCYFIRV